MRADDGMHSLAASPRAHIGPGDYAWVVMEGEALLTELPGPLAQIVKGALEAEGIPVRLHRDALSSIYGLDTGLFATQLFVPAARLEEARALIAEIEADDAE